MDAPSARTAASGSDSVHSGSYPWSDSPGWNYADDTWKALYSPLLDVSGAAGGSATLSYWLKYDLVPNYDHVSVDVQLDGGAWQNLLDVNGWGSGSFDQRSHTITIPAGTGTMQVRWVIRSDYSVTYDGAHVDDVGVVVNTPTATPTATLVPTATATATMTPIPGTFPVTYTYRGDGLRASKTTAGVTTTYT